MSSLSVASPVGAQRPRVFSPAEGGTSSAGAEAVDLARIAGLHLDPWQEFLLEHSLAERPDGSWAAFEVGVVVPRQNGKGAFLEARELAGLFLLGERFLIHSAHQFDTSLEAFRRLCELIESSDEFTRRVRKIKNSHGEEGIEMMSGQRIRFRTRTKGGGRGFSCDCLILDEAMILPESAHGALLPTLSARPNPQVIYTGSAVDQDVHEHGMVLTRVRERGLAGDDPRLMYAEWSADGEITDADLLADDQDAWAAGNPGLGIRITEEHVATEQRSMNPRTFAVERLGVGDWPDLNAVLDEELITAGEWRACETLTVAVSDLVALFFDVSPSRGSAAIVAASVTGDRVPVEVIDHRPGTAWVPGRLADLQRSARPIAVKCDERSPAAALVKDCEDAGVRVEMISTAEMVAACARFHELAKNGRLAHRADPRLSSALRGAARRSVGGGDGWAWTRTKSTVDICPLVAATGAVAAAETGVPWEFMFEVFE